MNKFGVLNGEINRTSAAMEIVEKPYGYCFQIVLHLRNQFPFSIEFVKKDRQHQNERYLPHSGHVNINLSDPTRLKNVDIYSNDKAAVTAALNNKDRERLDLINRCCCEFYIGADKISLIINAEETEGFIVKQIINEALNLASSLINKRNTLTLLLYNAEHDPVPTVRKHNLSILVNHSYE